LTTLFATPNHPFWVAGVQVNGEHWLATEYLAPGMVLQLADGRKATVHANGLVRRTQHDNIGFAADDCSGVGIVLELGAGRIALASDELTARLQQPGQTLKLGDPYLASVYNFEVAELHTYYVGEAAVWVHNANCDQSKAIDAVANKAESLCFGGDTQIQIPKGVMCEIKYLEVGDFVLSRCEKTDVQSYRRITKKFQHECDELTIVYFVTEQGDESAVKTTEEHPFWVEGVGWVTAGKLTAGQKFSIVNPIAVTDEYRPEGQKIVDLAMGGGRWQAEVTGVEKVSAVHEYAGEIFRETVYNIEVEDFHTYFVTWCGILVHNKNSNTVITGEVKPLERSTPKNQLKGYFDDPKNYPEAKMADINAQNNVLKEVAAHNFEVVTLPDSFANKLGIKSFNNPDAIIDGRVADAYSPTTNNIRNICSNIMEKTMNQAHDIVLDLSRNGLNAKAIFDNIAQYPIPTLGRLYIWDGENLYILDYGAIPVYGQWLEGPGVTSEKLPSVPSTGFVSRYRPSENIEAETDGFKSDIVQLMQDDIQSLLPAARQYWLNVGATEVQLDGIEFNIATLAPRVAAMTLGIQITLSADGAGWGWFVDTTPASHEEFTADDAFSEFKAQTGSTAEGKMDLLTVLIHEMGHTMGLGHVVGNGDVMAQYLTPGVRRLPAIDDIAALGMQQFMFRTDTRQTTPNVLGMAYFGCACAWPLYWPCGG
jgi:hypothetical protein